VMSAEEEIEVRQEWAVGQFRTNQQQAATSVESEYSARIGAGFSYVNHIFACDGIAVADAKAIAEQLQANGAPGNQAWADRDGTQVTMTNSNFISFARAISAWNSGHRAIARGKKASIAACADQAALDAYLNKSPTNSGWPSP